MHARQMICQAVYSREQRAKWLLAAGSLIIRYTSKITLVTYYDSAILYLTQEIDIFFIVALNHLFTLLSFHPPTSGICIYDLLYQKYYKGGSM